MNFFPTVWRGLATVVVTLCLLLGTARAEWETVFRYEFSEGDVGPWGVAAQSGGVVAAGAPNLTEELMAEFVPDGSNAAWLAGVRAYYVTPANAEPDRARLRFSFRARAEFGASGATQATLRARIFGFGTSETEAAATRDFVVTETMQSFVTTLDTWAGDNFDPLREANAVYLDVGGTTGERPWPGGPVAGGLRLVVDDIAFEALAPETPPEPVEYFVASGGSDQANGRSEATAFASIQRAANATRPGDVVTVLDGDYVEAVAITRSGVPGAPITYRARNRHGARVRNTWGNVFHIGSNTARVGHIVIDGFDVSTSAVYGSGIKSDRGAYHLYVYNNYAHDCGESGIQLNDGDYRFIEGNITARNGWLMPEAGSGISLWGMQPHDEEPGWHTVVRNNLSYANDNGPTTARTDGNGIIIDDFRNSQSGHTGAPARRIDYAGTPTLVEGNVVFANGGKGIQVFVSNQVWVVHNTAWLNNRRADTETWRGEINVSCSARVRVANNIAVTDSSGFAAAVYNTAFFVGALSGDLFGAEVTLAGNLGFDCADIARVSFAANGLAVPSAAAEEAGNRLALDPRLLAPAEAMAVGRLAGKLESPAAWFAPAADSPARGAAPAENRVAERDLAGAVRAGDPLAVADVGALARSARVALAEWRWDNFGVVEAAGAAGDEADPNGDGQTNLLEYALGTEPGMANTGVAHEAAAGGGASGGRLALTFMRARLAEELTYVVEGSPDLEEWSVVTSNPGAVSALAPVTVEDDVTAEDAPGGRRFMRLRVTVPE